MKFLITSDNHLGYKENDPLRGNDSFATFEEILQIAVREDVDMIIQGGDLFDENRPSRNTYSKTLGLLKEYCLGKSKGCLETEPPLNIADGGVNVAIPMLSIHGNHDDPSGPSAVSPLDVLHSAGVINYIGRQFNPAEIRLKPVLVRAGALKVAVFGMGYIKDRVIHRAFSSGAVSYDLPPGDGWYNILVVHQNRVPRAEEYLPESLIDPFFDLVVYGHEHESIQLRHRDFDLIQCGSTVRTSLSQGEAGPKNAYVLEIELGSVSISKKELGTVRPLLLESMKMEGESAERGIIDKLHQMLCPYKQSPLLPLVRLRVELPSGPGFDRRPISEWLRGKVANERDALLVVRKAEKRAVEKSVRSQRADIPGIYSELLKDADLEVVSEEKAVDALEDYLDAKYRDVWIRMADEALEEILRHADEEALAYNEIESVISRAIEAAGRAERVAARDTIHEMSEPHSSPALSSVSGLCQTGTPPTHPGSNKDDFTFLEDAREMAETDMLVAACQPDDQPDEDATESKKRQTDSDDLLEFQSYL